MIACAPRPRRGSPRRSSISSEDLEERSRACRPRRRARGAVARQRPAGGISLPSGPPWSAWSDAPRQSQRCVASRSWRNPAAYGRVLSTPNPQPGRSSALWTDGPDAASAPTQSSHEAAVARGDDGLGPDGPCATRAGQVSRGPLDRSAASRRGSVRARAADRPAAACGVFARDPRARPSFAGAWSPMRAPTRSRHWRSPGSAGWRRPGSTASGRSACSSSRSTGRPITERGCSRPSASGSSRLESASRARPASSPTRSRRLPRSGEQDEARGSARLARGARERPRPPPALAAAARCRGLLGRRERGQRRSAHRVRGGPRRARAGRKPVRASAHPSRFRGDAAPLQEEGGSS